VEQDDSKAFQWFRKSAMSGLPEGEFCLAYCYSKGIGVKINPVEATKWFRESALNGSTEGQFITGLRYKNGSGVDKDNVEAFAFFNLASMNKHDDARRNRIQIAKEMTREQIAEGKRRTKELQEQIKAVLPRNSPTL
jgi:TPR repeat protein